MDIAQFRLRLRSLPQSLRATARDQLPTVGELIRMGAVVRCPKATGGLARSIKVRVDKGLRPSVTVYSNHPAAKVNEMSPRPFEPDDWDHQHISGLHPPLFWMKNGFEAAQKPAMKLFQMAAQRALRDLADKT